MSTSFFEKIVKKKPFQSRKRKKFMLLILCLSTAFPLFPTKSLAQPNAHRHQLTMKAMDLVADEIKFIEATPDKNLKKKNYARSRNYESFFIYDENGNSRIFFSDRKTKKIYEILGIPLIYRPFSDLIWLNNQTLVFDRWANPHDGSHYEIDAKARKLKKVLMFRDDNESND